MANLADRSEFLIFGMPKTQIRKIGLKSDGNRNRVWNLLHERYVEPTTPFERD